MKLFRIALMALFVVGMAACSKGGDNNDNGQNQAAQPAQSVPAAAHDSKGGYDPNADADSDC